MAFLEYESSQSFSKSDNEKIAKTNKQKTQKTGGCLCEGRWSHNTLSCCSVYVV